MAKALDNVKGAEFETQAAAVLVSLLQDVPFLQVGAPLFHAASGIDFEVPIRWPGGITTLLCECKLNGQPAPARAAITRLQLALTRRTDATGILIAPYITEVVAGMCAELRIGTLDLSGNARLAFGNVYIRQSGRPNQFRERRELRSIFAPKASRILRVLLENPGESWQVQKLARESGVSIGQVSAVKHSLANMEWLAPDGLRLAHPETALRTWADRQGRVEEDRVECYSSETSDDLAGRVVIQLGEAGVRHAVSGTSAAWRLAPIVPPRRLHMYLDASVREWCDRLALKAVPSGGNVILIRPRDEGVFYRMSSESGLPVIGAVQTYLDCMRSGPRGEEAAEAVLQQRLRPTWRATPVTKMPR